MLYFLLIWYKYVFLYFGIEERGKKEKNQDWGWSSMVKHWPRCARTWDLIPSTGEKKGELIILWLPIGF
jgi:hypothetical protein